MKPSLRERQHSFMVLIGGLEVGTGPTQKINNEPSHAALGS